MKYLVVAIFINDVEQSELCGTHEAAIKVYNSMCNSFYNDNALAKFMQNNDYEEKTTEVFDNYYRSTEYYDFEDNSNVLIIDIDI